MALTKEFKDAVSSKNLLLVRIMMKNSLLVDNSFRQFKQMEEYAKGKSLNIWMEETEKIEKEDKSKYTVELMNLEMTKLVNNFTKEQVEYCQEIIKKVYPVKKPSSNGSKPSVTTKNSLSKSSKTFTSTEKTTDPKEKYYSAIEKSYKKIKKLLDNRSREDPWHYTDIKELRDEAKKMYGACENILKHW